MIKALLNRFSRKPKTRGLHPGIARWCIQQFVTCPHCDHEFDIIQHNLKRHSNQGTIKVTQRHVSRYDKDKFEYDEVTTEIPTPPYFGAMLENTENLDEHIDCEWCGKLIHVTEATWGYGR